MEAKKKAVELVPASKTKEIKEVQVARKRLETARGLYMDMQRDWYKFAQQMKNIRDLHDHDVLGVESFQKLCEREFPSMSYSLISKFIQIAEKLGDQIDKRLESAEYRIPTYETAYQLTTIQTKVSDEDYKKLSKQILDDKLSVRDFRERIKALITTAKKDLRRKIDDETDQFMEKTQKELDAELRSGLADDEEAYIVDHEDFEPEEDGEDSDSEVEDEDDSNENTIVGLNSRIEYLIDNLPDFVEHTTKLDGATKALIKKLKKLGSIIEETVETLNEI
jgi:hypothetical protein